MLMEEAQTVNLDIAAAVARIRQADAQAQTAGAALLPSLTGTFSGSRSRSSSTTGTITSATPLTGRGEVTNHTASLSASYEIDFWGKNRDALLAAEETANANRFARDVVALTTPGERRQRLLPGGGRAGADQHRDAQHRQRAAHLRRHQGARGFRDGIRS